MLKATFRILFLKLADPARGVWVFAQKQALQLSVCCALSLFIMGPAAHADEKKVTWRPQFSLACVLSLTALSALGLKTYMALNPSLSVRARQAVPMETMFISSGAFEGVDSGRLITQDPQWKNLTYARLPDSKEGRAATAALTSLNGNGQKLQIRIRFDYGQTGTSPATVEITPSGVQSTPGVVSLNSLLLSVDKETGSVASSILYYDGTTHQYASFNLGDDPTEKLMTVLRDGRGLALTTILLEDGSQEITSVTVK